MENEKKEKLLKYQIQIEREIGKFGKPHSNCPLCGEILKMEGTTASHTVFCDTENCFKYTVRGL